MTNFLKPLTIAATLAALGLAGGAPRTASLALYAVPEPTSIALVGIGLAALLIRRRRV